MTGREAGALVAKLLAIFVAMRAMVEVVILFADLASARPTRVLLEYGLLSGMLGLLALILWVQSGKFWPNDEALAGTAAIQARAIFALGLIGIAVYFTLVSAPDAIVSILRSTGLLASGQTTTRLAWAPIVRSFAAAGLLVYGVKMFKGSEIAVEKNRD